MNHTKKTLALAGALAVLLVGGGYRLHLGWSATQGTTTCPHTLAAQDCPFCTPALLQTKGFCGGHGVPEALCTRCHRELIPAFQAQGDWCAEHALPESQCVACNPELATARPPTPQGAGGSCALHGVPQAMCFVCSPGLIAAGGTCAEHGVPEALCTRCNAALIPAFRKTYDWCVEHEVPETQCVDCNPSLAPPAPAAAPTAPGERRRAAPRVGCRTHAQRIQLASAEVVRQAGILTTPVVRAPLRDLTTVSAELAYAADRYAALASRAGGTVREVRARLGARVQAGEVLALVESPALGAAGAELSNAVMLLDLWERNHAREVDLVARGVGTLRAVVDADTRRAEARAALATAEQALRGLGLDAEQVAELRRTGGLDPALPVRAPFAGVVVARDAVEGEVVEAGRPLVTIADTETLWALLDVPEAAISRIALGQPVVLTVHALRGEQFAGRITWLSSEVERRTRTLRARAELPNPDGRLRANQFASAEVTLSDRRDALLVPREAVQWEGCCNVVFVPEGDAGFLPRKVQLGGATGTHVEVLTGLAEGEAVVCVGAFLLKTELLKGSIGAGCCAGEE